MAIELNQKQKEKKTGAFRWLKKFGFGKIETVNPPLNINRELWDTRKNNITI